MPGMISPLQSVRMANGWLLLRIRIAIGILYLLELASGNIIRLTDTPEYDAAPSWSPDGAFLAYESDEKGFLGIYIRSVTDSAQVYALTQDSATDTSPAWSPTGKANCFYFKS